LNLDVVQQEDQKEYGYAEKQESCVVISSTALFIIEEVNDDPTNQRIEGEPQQQQPKTLGIKQGYSKKIQ
jgi:hypothetical protein